jgi:hypothetical protein
MPEGIIFLDMNWGETLVPEIRKNAISKGNKHSRANVARLDWIGRKSYHRHNS